MITQRVTLNSDLLLQTISAILAIVATLLGNKWIKTKNELLKLTKLTTKIATALKVTSDAIEDDKITQEEEKAIVRKWKDVIEEAKKFIET